MNSEDIAVKQSCKATGGSCNTQTMEDDYL